AIGGDMGPRSADHTGEIASGQTQVLGEFLGKNVGKVERRADQRIPTHQRARVILEHGECRLGRQVELDAAFGLDSDQRLWRVEHNHAFPALQVTSLDSVEPDDLVLGVGELRVAGEYRVSHITDLPYVG